MNNPLNLRKTKQTNEDTLKELWTKRLTLCSDRKANEEDVEKHNKKISKLLMDILVPVAKRTEMPIYVEICEGLTNISIPFTYNTRTTNLRPKITFIYPSVYELFLTRTDIEENIRKIEANVRFVKRSLKPHSPKILKTEDFITQRNRLLVDNPGSVFVTFNTRTRYF